MNAFFSRNYRGARSYLRKPLPWGRAFAVREVADAERYLLGLGPWRLLVFECVRSTVLQCFWICVYAY